MQSYVSIEQYIGSLRRIAISRLSSGASIEELATIEVSDKLESLAKDLQTFKRFRRINRYKYE